MTQDTKKEDEECVWGFFREVRHVDLDAGLTMRHICAYLEGFTLEKVFSSQDMVLREVQETLAGPQHSDGEKVGEGAA